MSHPSRSGKAPSQRQLRVAEEIRHALARVFERGEVHEPSLTEPPISVTEVRISPDLKNATVFVVRLGGGDMTEALQALARARGYLRHKVAETIHTKYTPELRFAADESFDEAGHINALLHSPDVVRDLKAGAVPDGAEDASLEDASPEDASLEDGPAENGSAPARSMEGDA